MARHRSASLDPSSIDGYTPGTHATDDGYRPGTHATDGNVTGALTPPTVISAAGISTSSSGILRPTPGTRHRKLPDLDASGMYCVNFSKMRDKSSRSKNVVQSKRKKNVSFSPEKNLVEVFEISPRPEPPLTEELAPCDIDKLIQEQKLENYRYVYGSFSLQRFKRIADHHRDNQDISNFVRSRPPHGVEERSRHDVRTRRLSAFKGQSGGQIHIHQPSSFNSHTVDKDSLKGILTNGASLASSPVDGRCTQQKHDGLTLKPPVEPGRDRQQPHQTGQMPRRLSTGLSNRISSASDSLAKGFQLKVSGESFTAGKRIHPSPYRQSSAPGSRPLGSVRLEAALSVTGARLNGDKTLAGRRVQSAAPHVSPRKVYAWRAADSAMKGGDLDQAGPCIAQLWNLTPRTGFESIRS